MSEKNRQRRFIPWAKPHFWGNEVTYVTDALNSSWISGGPYIDKLEDNFKRYFKKKYALCVSNGTTALHLAYMGLDLKQGDEVIVPGYGFMAAANIALHLGLKPVFAEVDPGTWCLSTEKLPEYITSKTKAIIPIHTYGNVCSMDDIMKIANGRGITVIEDCAESLFSKYKKGYCGTYGKVSTFSFQATKTITTGEGGMVVTDSDELAERMHLYRSHGMNRAKKYYWHELPGHNFRLTNFQAAMGVAQLEKKDFILQERQRVYHQYKKHLTHVECVVLQKIEENAEPVIWTVAVKLNPQFFPQGRDRVIEQLKEKGIESRPGFYASSFLEIYEPHSLSVCEEISKNVICLPTFPGLKNEEIAWICNQLFKLRKNEI